MDYLFAVATITFVSHFLWEKEPLVYIPRYIDQFTRRWYCKAPKLAGYINRLVNCSVCVSVNVAFVVIGLFVYQPQHDFGRWLLGSLTAAFLAWVFLMASLIYGFDWPEDRPGGNEMPDCDNEPAVPDASV